MDCLFGRLATMTKTTTQQRRTTATINDDSHDRIFKLMMALMLLRFLLKNGKSRLVLQLFRFLAYMVVVIRLQQGHRNRLRLTVQKYANQQQNYQQIKPK